MSRPKGYYRHTSGAVVWLLGLARDPDGHEQSVWHKAQGAVEGDLRVTPAESFFLAHVVVYPDPKGDERT